MVNIYRQRNCIKAEEFTRIMAMTDVYVEYYYDISSLFRTNTVLYN